MILAQRNIVKFYATKSNRNWDNSDNKQQHIVFLPVNNDGEVLVPDIELIVSTAVASPSISICFNKNDVVAETATMDVEAATGYSRLIHLGGYSETFTIIEDYFYLKIVNGIYTYYSDVFAATADTGNLLKISATSSNISLGRRNDYVLNLTGFTFLCYLNVWQVNQPIYLEEEYANERDGVVTPYYCGQSKQLNWVISGTEYILDFLKLLRILSINGSVSITWKGESITASEIEAEIEESYNDATLLDISLKVIPYSDVVAVINETN